MSDGLVVRQARPDDALAITRYHHRCWVESFTDLVTPGAVEAMDPLGKLERWRLWLAPGSGFVTMVADDDGRPVGHTTVSGHELVHLFIDPDHQGRGLGRRLLAVAEELLAEAGHTEIELQTMVGNDPAIGLYLATDWRMTEELVHNDVDGVVYDEHVLRKSLGS